MLDCKVPRVGYIPTLDGLRAIAVMMVVIAHGYGTIFSSAIVNNPIAYLLDQGRLGVSIFFVLSGYLITTLLVREEIRGGISLGNFAIRRGFRIFPAFYAYLLVVSLLNAANYLSISWINIVCAAGLVYNYHYFLVPEGVSHLHQAKWAVGHTWTLAIEEQFYLIWPAAMASIGRAGGAAALVVTGTACIAARLAIYLGLPQLRPGLPSTLLGVADPLLAGCLLAFVDATPWARSRLLFVTRKISPLTILIILLVGDRTAFHWLGYAWSLTIGNGISSVLISLLIFSCVSRPSSWSSRFLESPCLRYVGRRSYSIYLWQQLFFMNENQTMFGTFPLNFIATFVVAELSFQIIEQPVLILKDRIRWNGLGL